VLRPAAGAAGAENATDYQRIAWHTEHAKHCGCRKIEGGGGWRCRGSASADAPFSPCGRRCPEGADERCWPERNLSGNVSSFPAPLIRLGASRRSTFSHKRRKGRRRLHVVIPEGGPCEARHGYPGPIPSCFTICTAVAAARSRSGSRIVARRAYYIALACGKTLARRAPSGMTKWTS
jgi:hypothetical protein